MGFRFRRSIRLLPGVRINLSKTGPSLTAGVRGVTTNISSKGMRNTASLPGTGLSCVSERRPLGEGRWFGWVVLLVVVIGVCAWALEGA